MANFDTTQMVLALFLFACGAVPAIVALIGEKRERRASERANAQLLHEEARWGA